MQKFHVEGDPKLKNTSSKQYSMFIGRWQPWHSGHKWLIDQRLNEGKNVLICIRDIQPDEKNPFGSGSEGSRGHAVRQRRQPDGRNG